MHCYGPEYSDHQIIIYLLTVMRAILPKLLNSCRSYIFTSNNIIMEVAYLHQLVATLLMHSQHLWSLYTYSIYYNIMTLYNTIALSHSLQ